MRRWIIHIAIGLALLTARWSAQAQGDTVKYVQRNSVHALAVPENPDYSFIWEITYGFMGDQIAPGSNTNVTADIEWDRLTTYKVTVYPVLDSVDCPGEPKVLYVKVVNELSLHAMDDYYHTPQGTTVYGDLSVNDFDDSGASLLYNDKPVRAPAHGKVIIDGFGKFSYVPDDGFTGVDFFTYSVCNNNTPPMCDNAVVTIVVEPRSGNADVVVYKTGPHKVLFGGEIEYLLVVKNEGPETARNVVLRDNMPFGVFRPQYSLGSPDFIPWPDSLAIGTIAAGDSLRIRIRGEVSNNSPQWLYNQAIAYSDNTDPDIFNNDSIWPTEVVSIFVESVYMTVPSCSTATISVKSESVSQIASYLWQPGTNLNDSTASKPVFTPDTAGLYQYVFTITDILGRKASDTVFITVPEKVGIIMPDTLFIDLDSMLIVDASASKGVGLTYSWSTNNGTINSGFTNDSITISKTGIYYLRLRDQYGCIDNDSVTVLLKSHPPIAINDTVSIVAGTDSTFNILLNDYDFNGFDIRVTNILTPPTRHDIFEWDSAGNITFQPNIKYWGWDSIQYEVCNNGYPEKCSSAWVLIHSLRPPLNADLAIVKEGPKIAFWGEQIDYKINVSNLGPDTLTSITIHDPLATGLENANYSINGGVTWRGWNGRITYTDSLYPNTSKLEILIRAYINHNTPRMIENKAWVVSSIIENDYSNDTSVVATKIKTKVVADAGRDLAIGACVVGDTLDGSKSTGDNLTYRWTPTQYLTYPDSAKAFFRSGVSTTYVLTVTDDDGITDSDTMRVLVLPPPVANAGPDLFAETDVPVSPNGTASTGAGLSYRWTTPDGNFLTSPTSPRPIVDKLGTYILTVTDSVGCSSTDTMNVYQFYFLPFAIPDYYSVLPRQTLNGNVLENDHEPNGMFNLSVVPGTVRTKRGVNINLQSDGSFTYLAPELGFGEVDEFTYTVCNNAVPPRCSRGYVLITIPQQTSNPPVANLHIEKRGINAVVLAGKEVEWEVTVTNKGPETVSQFWITDSLSMYIEPPYAISTNNGLSYTNISNPGKFSVNNLAPGQKYVMRIKGKVKNDAPSIIFNASTVSSVLFDDAFDWTDKDNRNVDTASVRVETDLYAIAEFVERNPLDNNKTDNVIGACDRASFLSGLNSMGDDIVSVSWSPANLLVRADTMVAQLRPEVADTTVTFYLTLFNEAGKFSFDTVSVTISPKVNADGGPNRKMNEGEVLVIDGTNSSGAQAIYQWWDADDPTRKPLTNFEDGNPLKPIIDRTGNFVLWVTDQHGCYDIDTVSVRENSLHAVNDLAIVIRGRSFRGNVAMNDFDPDRDSIYYLGQAVVAPQHGTLQPNPPLLNGLDTITDNRVIAHDGTFVYVPDSGYIGFDSFTYEVCDNNNPNLCQTARVLIKVVDIDSINTPPVATPDAFFAVRGDTLYANVIINDFDLDGNTVYGDSIAVQKPAGGNILLTRDGDLDYYPVDNTRNYDELKYRICDDGIPSKCDTALVGIRFYKVKSENHPPVAVDDAFFAVEKAITGNLLDNDFDLDIGDHVYFSKNIVHGPSNGTLVLDPSLDGTFSYTPNAGFEGTDWFVYEICDDSPSEPKCSQATVYIVCLDESRYRTDVQVVKTAPAELVSNDTIQYSITVKVVGPTFANDVVLLDTLSNLLTNATYSVDGSPWSAWPGSLHWERMQIGEERKVTIRAKLPANVDMTIVNTAWAKHDMREKNPADNQSTVSTRVYQKVVAHAGADTILGACVPEYKLDGTASVGMNNSTLQYSWTPANRLTGANTATPVFRTEPGTHMFTLVVTNTHRGFTRRDTAKVTVQVYPFPVAYAGVDQWPTTSDPVTLDGSGSTGVGPLVYRWYYNDRSGNVIEMGDTPVITVNKTADYFLTVTDIKGCQSTDMVRVGYPIDPYEAKDDYFEIYQQATDTIFVLDNDYIDEDDEYRWPMVILNGPFFGQARLDPVTMSVIYTPQDYFCAAMDSFEYTISTASGHTSSAWVRINVLCLDPIVPFGFSPNSDGINDFLIIEHIDLYPQNKIQVFNRWGNLVYLKERYTNSEPWDGVANKGLRIGRGALPTAAYIYILDLGDLGERNTHRRILKGYLYIASDNR